ncbi:MAG: KOW motif-containing protein, partial [Treponema sp.]|nr:KOW motif-containing protein [Treponema sp.]
LQQSGDLKGEKKVRVKQSFEVNDKVKIIEGPFASFSGVVEEFYADKNKLRVNVQIFGRETPVEVDILQVEKI